MQEEEISVSVRGSDAKALTAMLASSELRFTVGGWLVKTFTISGSPDALAAFQPALREWQADCESRDAW